MNDERQNVIRLIDVWLNVVTPQLLLAQATPNPGTAPTNIFCSNSTIMFCKLDRFVNIEYFSATMKRSSLEKV